MSFLSTLGKILKFGQAVAPGVVTAINPAAGAITGVALNAVVKAEESGGTGPQKKQKVMQEVIPTVGPLVSTLLASSGAKVDLNSTGVTNAVSQIVDGIVSLLNAIQAAPAAAATGASSGSSAAGAVP
jgi:hypothetical protein